MSLYQKPPDTIMVDGVEHPVDTDFRAWVRFQGVLLSDSADCEKAEKLCHMMDEMGLPVSENTLKSMLQFYRGASTENSTGGGENVLAYDFERDSEYIFSAFLDSYGIDLTTEKLHWWRFKALFKSLPEDCQMCKIIGYRTVDISKVPKEQRRFYKEMKQRYSLKSGTGPKTKEQIIEYHKKRRAEEQSRMSKMRGDKRAGMD